MIKRTKRIIKEGTCYRCYTQGKDDVMFIDQVSESFREGRKYETIYGTRATGGHSCVISRNQIMEELPRETHPEYWL